MIAHTVCNYLLSDLTILTARSSSCAKTTWFSGEVKSERLVAMPFTALIFSVSLRLLNVIVMLFA